MAEEAVDLIGNKIADKITSVSMEWDSKKSPNEDNHEIPKKKDIYLQKKDNKLLMN